jgi:hypothetical protein
VVPSGAASGSAVTKPGWWRGASSALARNRSGQHIAADTGHPDVVLYKVNGARRGSEQEQTVGMFVD